MSSLPAVSVALITFNDEKYVRDAIRSVLRQTFSELELVIVDDGSTDGTARAIAEFSDPRIVSIRQENRGSSAAMNRAIAACRGRYIALLAGDDVCHADRVAAQWEAHRRAGGGMVFSNVDYIDDRGDPIEAGHFPKDFFALPPMSQAQILEAFFRRGNFIHPITCFAEAQTLRDAAPIDPLLCQFNDYEWLIRLVKKQPFTVMRRCTLSARTRSGNANMSAFTPRKNVRCTNELYLVLRRFFDDVSPDLFREAFREQLIYPDSRSDTELACEQAFLYLRHPQFPVARLIGVEKLHNLFQDPSTAVVLRDHFHFTPTAFAALLLDIDPFNQLSRYESLLFVDTGKGFNSAECCKTLGNHLCETFELTFDLSAFASVCGLRWDPVELQLCQVQLEAVCWRDRKGNEHAVDLAQIQSNGQRRAEGSFAFQTLDPMVFLPIAGEAQQLTLRGRWQVTEPNASAFQINTLLLEREEALRRRDEEFQERETALSDLRRVVQARDQELQAMRNSRSWRWLSAVRSLIPLRGRRRTG